MPGTHMINTVTSERHVSMVVFKDILDSKQM